jgi:nucleoside-diphosphate-sugar epimerase
MKKKVVVTGASGHIGYHVALQLLESQASVILLTRTINQHIEELKGKGAQVLVCNLRSPASYDFMLEDTDALFHMAAENTTDTHQEQRIMDNTIELSKTVLDTAIDKKVKTIIYTSSVVVLGRSSSPAVLIHENNTTNYLESPYVKGKFLAEQYCEQLIREKSVDIRRLYPSWVIGKNDLKLTPPHKIVSDYYEKGQVFYFKGGISIAAVEEVAKAHVNAWTLGKPGEKYIVAGSNITFQTFYSLLAKYSGHKPPFMFVPKWIIYLGALLAKLLLGRKSPVDPNYIRTVIGNYSWYTSEKAIRELHYKIVPAEQILSEAVRDAIKRQAGLYHLVPQYTISDKRIAYADNDVLLITGFPGWLGNRMVDIFMNGDRHGNYAVKRKIKLLVQPKFKDLISLPPEFEIVYGDITSKTSLQAALTGVSAVYHLAGVIYPKQMHAFQKVNEEGTRNLVDVCIEKGIKRILFMGTDSICGYGRRQRIFDEHAPPSPYKDYGRSKYLGEKYILDKTKDGLIQGTSLRGFWFFGPFMPERNKAFFRMFGWKRQIVFGNGKNFRSISHVDNIVQAFVKAEKSHLTIGKWYWIGNRHPNITVDDIYRHIAESFHVPYKPCYIPVWMCELFNLGDRILSIFGKLNPTLHAAGKFHKDIAGDITAAQRDFGYNPEVDFKEIVVELPKLVTVS